MPSEVSLSMRRTKLKAEEAALLAGEVEKPSWESRNEGIHERVSFEDAIWGFDLAGGAYYETPLRVTFVKPNSRAEKAGIRPGDKLLRINDIDTSTLTIQEAHKIIVDSGIHLRLAVTAPEDEEDSYFCYEDPIEEVYDSEEERRIEEEKARKREVHAKVSSYWSLQWPWVSKRKIIYRESNCFMVPSKYEDKHRDKFSKQPFHKIQDDIVLHSVKSKRNLENQNSVIKTQQQTDEEPFEYHEKTTNNSKVNNDNVIESKYEIRKDNIGDLKRNGIVPNVNLENIPEIEEVSTLDENAQLDMKHSTAGDEVDNSDSDQTINCLIKTDNKNTTKQDGEKEFNEILSNGDEIIQDIVLNEATQLGLTNSTSSDEITNSNNDKIINDIIDSDYKKIAREDEEQIINGILSNGDDEYLSNPLSNGLD